MSSQAEIFCAVVKAASDAYAAGTLTEDMPAAFGGTNRTHDAPDRNGCVALTGLPAGNGYAGYRFQINEITQTLTGEQRGKAFANLGHANTLYQDTQLIGAVFETVQRQSDGEWVIPDPPAHIPNTQSLPSAIISRDPNSRGQDLGTVAGATAWFSQLPAPGGLPNPIGWVPGH